MTEDDQTKVEQTEDGKVKITQTKGRRRKGVTVLLDPDDLVREQVGGFSKFLQEYAVIGLALGFIVGQPANEVVKQFVGAFINPLFQIIFGQNLSSRAATFHHGTKVVLIPWGGFVFALIEFLVVLITIYAAVKILKLDRYIRNKEAKKQ